jgi:hypothetical protein
LSQKLENTLSELLQNGLPIQEKSSTQESQKDILPSVEEELESVEPESEEVSVESEGENDSDLDPPVGIGLKFDEIEEMIDELLSSEI